MYYFYLNYSRFIASLWVILYHLKDEISLYNNLIIFDLGYLAVDYFFILSGFIIASIYLNKCNSIREFINYIFKRLKRIYPMHFLMCIIFLIIIILFKNIFSTEYLEKYFSFKSLFFNLFLIHSWGFENNLTWNIPSWSISTEFFTYLVFPFLCHSKKRLLDFIIFIILFISFLLIYFEKGNLNFNYDYGIVRNIFSFYCGYIIFKYNLYLVNNLFPIILSILSVFLVIYLKQDIYFLVLFSCMIIILSKFNKNSFPLFNFLGDISYSIYINQWIIILTLKYFRAYYYFSDITFISSVLILNILISSITYQFFERKFIR